MPARPRTPNMPHRLNTMPIGTAPERPPVPTRSSTLPHARSHSAGGGNGNSGTYPFVLDDEESDANRRRVRAEMMQWVKSEVESIEKETSETAKRNLENIRKNIRRRGSITVEPPTPIRIAEENSNPFHYVRKPQSRRGSVDSAVAGGWKPVEIPRKAKDWERWAENKVQARRRLDEVWRNEENVVDEAERLIKETQTQEKIRRERDARKQWERQAFLEKERQRAAREEQERMGRTQELQDALRAESLRQQELEREVRRIEQEARRLEEELRQRERKLQQEEAAARAKAQQERVQREKSRERPSQHSSSKPSPDPIWHPSDLSLDSDSDYFGAEWQRFAEIFKQGLNRSNSRVRYQSPAATFKEAWEAYETRWSQLSKPAPQPGGSSTKATPCLLGFADIPWPVLHQPTRASDVASLMTESSISSFILSPFHATSGPTASSPKLDTKTRKARLREALLRWHPDKMARILASITGDDERENAKAGAEAVARHLNALLARES